mgnify:CR=1 FL=1
MDACIKWFKEVQRICTRIRCEIAVFEWKVASIYIYRGEVETNFNKNS